MRRGLVLACESGAERVGYLDADLARATPPHEIRRLARVMSTGTAQVVFGARVALLGHEIERSAIRHYLGRVFATLASTTLRLAAYDTQCGAKLFRVTPTLIDAIGTPFLSRWAFDVELIGRMLCGSETTPPIDAADLSEEPCARGETSRDQSSRRATWRRHSSTSRGSSSTSHAGAPAWQRSGAARCEAFDYRSPMKKLRTEIVVPAALALLLAALTWVFERAHPSPDTSILPNHVLEFGIRSSRYQFAAYAALLVLLIAIVIVDLATRSFELRVPHGWGSDRTALVVAVTFWAVLFTIGEFTPWFAGGFVLGLGGFVIARSRPAWVAAASRLGACLLVVVAAGYLVGFVIAPFFVPVPVKTRPSANSIRLLRDDGDARGRLCGHRIDPAVQLRDLDGVAHRDPVQTAAGSVQRS